MDPSKPSSMPPDSPWLQHTYSGSEQALLLSWTLLGALVAVTGNSVVLVSSLKYNAIRLDRISIVLIRNLAVADLGHGLYLMTTTVLIITQSNVFGDTACYIISTISNFFMGASFVFVSALNANKLSTLIFPLKSNMRRYRRGRRISYTIWFLMTVFIVVILIPVLLPGNLHVLYSSASLRCLSQFYSESGPVRLLAPLVAMVFTLVPLLVIVVTTVWLIYYVAKVRGISRQTLLTLLCVSLTSLFSFLPTCLFYLAQELVEDSEKSAYWSRVFFRVAVQVVNVNSMANPLIYLFTVQSFGGFVKMIAGKIWVRFYRNLWGVRRRVRTILTKR